MPSRKETAFLKASAVQRSLSLVGLIVAVLVLLSSIGIAGRYVFLQPKPTLVTVLQDNEVGSLRWCINNAPSGSTITFDTSLWGHTIMLTGDLPIANKSLSIAGPGAHILTITNNTHQILVSFGASIRISGLTFKGSKFNSHALLSNNGMLTLTNSTISDNTASGANGNGGGIINNNGGTLTITNSTISDNTTSNSYGGSGIFTTNNLAHLPSPTAPFPAIRFLDQRPPAAASSVTAVRLPSPTALSRTIPHNSAAASIITMAYSPSPTAPSRAIPHLAVAAASSISTAHSPSPTAPSRAIPHLEQIATAAA